METGCIKWVRHVDAHLAPAASGGRRRGLRPTNNRVPRGDGTVDPDSPTTDAEEGDDDAAEDSEE